MFRREPQYYYNENFRFAQDYELWIRIMRKHQAHILEESLVSRRVSSNMISLKHQRAQRYYALKAKLTAVHFQQCWPKFLFYILKDLAVVLLPKPLLSLIKSAIHLR